ncbi:hypothetical protein APUTEX25_002465 [Auxenochlorella protothecoides]|nr:hypothetical protein APUTEX25_002465 [Auxenochlorella protothecoides]|eukprot:RMZ56275.1 hypothetical protein APUTEX25_002465 [Auxenochlorella protothecoides]
MMGQIGAERCLHTPQADAAEGSPGPLAGIKVLDLGQVVAGNFAGALLAYYGADVVKVEPPGKGDALRSLRLTDASGTSLWWRSYGRNRRCITVDLHSAAGQGVVRRLAGRSDVLVENFRPGVMEGWGLGPKDLPPHLIYTRISGYGQTGPRAREPGYASVCEAYGGLRAINGFPDGPPIRPNISLGDSLAGLHAAFGAVMALLHRDRARGPGGACAGPGTPSGSGQVVDVAISESIFNMMEGAVPEWFTHRAIRPPSGTTLTNVVPSGAWQAQDGKYVIIGGNGNSVYNRLVAAMGREDLGLTNPRFATDAVRNENEEELNAVIATWVAGRSSEEVMSVLKAARVPAGPILNMADIAGEAQYQARGMFQPALPPGGGEEVVLPAMSPVLGGTPGRTRWAGPGLGQHTEEVLREELGMTQEEVADLRQSGAI